ncbi:alpha-1,2-mannosyltransferase [Kibdelosporangium banguiense]|uniref:Alpha-1,2-mannosyltransferase n=1 Tax=Kibdelosporangium banguiense TaxID=1365924 RepID=A0ABS4TR00_9PSEU|nr:glycosyltransferase 87 family protein [Kibdelosporangium banguiense]MBP2326306.1 alpha-1,2-mannosyltransferase [Kibdelosporangium banguiense]
MSVSSSTVTGHESRAAGPSSEVPRYHLIPRPVFWAVVVLGILAIGAYLAQVLEDPIRQAHQVDLFAYRVAGERVLDGRSLYDTPLIGDTKGVFEFVYSPFAALVFTPLTALSGVWFTVAGTLGNFLLLAVVVGLTLGWLGYRRDSRLALFSVGVAGLLLWCEPIRQSVIFGQVNLILLALVLVDLMLPDRMRGKGALIGVAAGIKLIPAFFVLYLLVTRRFRAAAVAGVSFAATVLLGFLLLPKDSVTFWAGAFLDPTRVGVPEHPGNETLRGMIVRTIGEGGFQQLLWVVLAGAVAVVGLLLARQLSLHGRELPAVLLCGLVSTAVSPYSWPHHWVWLGLFVVYLLHLSLRPGAVTARFALVATVLVTLGGVFAFVDPDVSTLLAIPSWGHLGVFYHNAYIWLLFAIIAVTARRIHGWTTSQATQFTV